MGIAEKPESAYLCPPEKRSTMKKLLLLLFAAALVSAAPPEPVKKNPDGTVTINTASLKTVEGYFGPTPLIIHLDAKGTVTKIEALPNDETPSYWETVMADLPQLFVGVPANKIPSMEVDAVSGATYSSEGFLSSLRTGIRRYLKEK